ncbi:hypothetical protein [Macrococcus armenti]|uniref:hypothetical protein n=1 Tax=Macrococcus armenti TaxID=2875764 RepID=UPI001CCD3878|nr:hypothetical protein [Macrococcus armenti]UBH09613.1 hypothetical protein LAU41_05400 [Macrococcus armenti]UBH11888.1 hypothetical protein LAU38_05325 [Macrococcus armenti]
MEITKLIEKYKKQQKLIESLINQNDIHQNSILLSKIDVYEEVIKDLQNLIKIE